MSMNQAYFEYYEFDASVVLIATCIYNSLLKRVRMSETSWISILLTQSYSKFHEYLWVEKKRFIADLWLEYKCIALRW